MNLTASTAPPPSNPQLQYCLEEYVWQDLQDGGADVRAAIASAKALDLAVLPKALAKDIGKAFDSAETALEQLAAVQTAEVAVDAAAEDYRPVHTFVRRLEKDLRRHEEHVKDAETSLSRLREEDGPDRRAELEAIAAEGRIAIAALEAQMPADWKEISGTFRKLDDAESKLRNGYRRAADQSYQPVIEVLEVIDAVEGLRALEAPLREMRAAIETGGAPAALVEQVTELRSLISGVEGAGDIRSAVNKARSALRSNTPDPAEAIVQMDAALAEWEADLAWRTAAAEAVAPGLRAYEAALRGTIGARSQNKMSEDIALYVAACKSGHRDISMHF